MVPADAIEIDPKGKAVTDQPGQRRFVLQGFIEGDNEDAVAGCLIHGVGDECRDCGGEPFGHGDQQHAALGRVGQAREPGLDVVAQGAHQRGVARL